jgi:hypothetical protein
LQDILQEKQEKAQGGGKHTLNWIGSGWPGIAHFFSRPDSLSLAARAGVVPQTRPS